MQEHCIPVINLCTKLKRTGICMEHGQSTLRGRERKKPDDSLYGKWKRITHGMALGRKNKKARIPPSNLCYRGLHSFYPTVPFVSGRETSLKKVRRPETEVSPRESSKHGPCTGSQFELRFENEQNCAGE